MDKVAQIIDALNTGMNQALTNKNHSAYSQLSVFASDLEIALREFIQSQTTDQIKTIVQKLAKGTSISAEELKFVRMWVIGDAEQYVKLENNFQEWNMELKRLTDEINKLRGASLTIDSSFKLRSLLLDLMRTLGDINFYLQQKERVEKFEESTKNLEHDECRLLADLLLRKMESPEY